MDSKRRETDITLSCLNIWNVFNFCTNFVLLWLDALEKAGMIWITKEEKLTELFLI